jgi:hypothetical protein
VRGCQPHAQPQAGGPPLVSCPRLLIQYIRSYPPYPEEFLPFATWGRVMPSWQGTHLTWPVFLLIITSVSSVPPYKVYIVRPADKGQFGSVDLSKEKRLCITALEGSIVKLRSELSKANSSRSACRRSDCTCLLTYSNRTESVLLLPLPKLQFWCLHGYGIQCGLSGRQERHHTSLFVFMIANQIFCSCMWGKKY